MLFPACLPAGAYGGGASRGGLRREDRPPRLRAVPVLLAGRVPAYATRVSYSRIDVGSGACFLSLNSNTNPNPTVVLTRAVPHADEISPPIAHPSPRIPLVLSDHPGSSLPSFCQVRLHDGGPRVQDRVQGVPEPPPSDGRVATALPGFLPVRVRGRQAVPAQRLLLRQRLRPGLPDVLRTPAPVHPA